MTEHAHDWRVVTHADSCHFYLWTYSCRCGAAMQAHGERDLKTDEYSAVWWRDDCERCCELRGGSPPQHNVQIVAADGSVERDETTEAR